MDETLTSQYSMPEEDTPQQVEVLIMTMTLSEDERRRGGAWRVIHENRVSAENGIQAECID